MADWAMVLRRSMGEVMPRVMAEHRPPAIASRATNDGRSGTSCVTPPEMEVGSMETSWESVPPFFFLGPSGALIGPRVRVRVRVWVWVGVGVRARGRARVRNRAS